jgi:hypothetical protein
LTGRWPYSVDRSSLPQLRLSSKALLTRTKRFRSLAFVRNDDDREKGALAFEVNDADREKGDDPCGCYNHHITQINTHAHTHVNYNDNNYNKHAYICWSTKQCYTSQSPDGTSWPRHYTAY